jgi:hypothetical protein
MTRQILSPLFALLIFAAHLNCVVEHQLADLLTVTIDGQTSLVKGKRIGLASKDSPPIRQDSDDCEHGCICKGATLVEGFDWSEKDEWIAPAFFCNWLSADLLTTLTATEFTNQLGQQLCCRPLRATQRCALLQSFQI